MLARLNPFRRSRCLGLDLGSHSLKWALLDGARREVLQSGCQELFPERSGRYCVPDPGQAEERLFQFLAQVPAEFSAVSAVQGRTTVYGYLEFPPLAEEELKVAAQAEAQRWIPFPPEEVQFSYTRVPTLTREPGSGVFYVAALRSHVNRLRDLLTRCGRTPQRLETPALALAREYEANHGQSGGQFVAIVQLGYSLTHLVLCRDGFPYYARDFAPAAEELVECLQSQLACSWGEAESELRRSSPYDPRLAAPMRRLVRELRRTLAAAPAPATRLTLCGGQASPNLAEFLESHLDLPVSCDGWEQVLCPQPPALLKLAVGLAIA